jgi:hypothetical protein
VIGFALHNATEGFAITAPLAGDTDADGAPRRPSWGLLLVLGLIGGWMPAPSASLATARVRKASRAVTYRNRTQRSPTRSTTAGTTTRS